MVLPDSVVNDLIQKVLPLLHVNTELQEQKRKVSGVTLLAQGQRIDKNNKPIEGHIMYLWDEVVEVPINHARRIRHMIEDATSEDDLQTRIATHVVKYGKMPEVKQDYQYNQKQ